MSKEYHKYANIIPKMSDEEFEELKLDIEENGLLEDIILLDGKILDGRHRYEACQEIERKPEFKDFSELDIELSPLEYILSENLKRRHLTSSQKAAIAVDAEDVMEKLQQEAKERKAQAEGKKRGEKKSSVSQKVEQENNPNKQKTDTKLAKTFDTNRQYVSDAKKIKEEDPEAHEDIKNGEETISGYKKKKKEKPHVTQNSGNNEWYTPKKYIEQAREIMGSIDLDPASSKIANETVKADKFFSKDDNGLEEEWYGNVWLNPPYSYPEISDFSNKLVEQWKLGNIKQACLLVNNSTETDWFQKVASEATSICFIDTRIVFRKSSGEPGNSPLQGQCLIYFGDNENILKEKCNGVTYERRN